MADNKNPGKDKLIVTAILFAVGGFAILFLSSFKSAVAPKLGSGVSGSGAAVKNDPTGQAATDPTADWAVDPATGMLISPSTGNLYDPSTGNIYDPSTGQYLGNIADTSGDSSGSTDQSQSSGGGDSSGGGGSYSGGYAPAPPYYPYGGYPYFPPAVIITRPGGVAQGTKLANLNPNLIKGGVVDQMVVTQNPTVTAANGFLASQGIVATPGSIGLSVGGPSANGPVRAATSTATLTGNAGHGGYTFNRRHDCGCGGKSIRRNDCGCGK